MDESSILIIGANGQLGSALSSRYASAIKVDSNSLDITDWQALENYNWSNIKIIINAAAYTNVDGAEFGEGKITAWKVNAQAVASLVKIALKHDLLLVHISSEYVFDGTKGPHTENEDLSPLGVYAQTKAAGDIAVSILPKHYIVRTSWVIGEGKNFVRTMLELGKKGINPTVIADDIGRPTFTTDLVKAIDHLIGARPESGVYNVSNEGAPVSWADFTRAIYDEAGFDLRVEDTTDAKYYIDKLSTAPRPQNSLLDLSKIRSSGFVPKDWHEELKNYVNKELGR